VPLGLPALSVPFGMVGATPAGLQLITGSGEEELVFALAEKVSADSD
jgi:Asp-tRNA(Asn)/Glu-tRNA(Gln) amidotransferase A subunit family amidase